MHSADRLRNEHAAWRGVLSHAAALVAEGAGDDLVVLPRDGGDVYQGALHASAQHDDDVSAIAAIDVLRVLVTQYEIDNEEE